MKRKIIVLFFVMACAFFSNSVYSMGESKMEKEPVDLISKFVFENTDKIIIETLQPQPYLIAEILDSKTINVILNGIERIHQKTLIDTLCNYKIIFYGKNNVLAALELHHDINYPRSSFFRLREKSNSYYEDYLADAELSLLLDSIIKEKSKNGRTDQVTSGDRLNDNGASDEK